MTSELILVIAAVVCVIGVAVFLACAIKWRDEEWAGLLGLGVVLCFLGAAACFQGAVERSDAREHQRPTHPVKVNAKPAP
jgi:hypothetical protein